MNVASAAPGADTPERVGGVPSTAADQVAGGGGQFPDPGAPTSPEHRRDLAVTYRTIADLVPYASNSRTHSDAQIAEISASIRQFGWTNPVLIDERGTIVAGHGRVLAARKLDLDQVPCIVLRGLTNAQRAAYVIADNKLALNAGWNAELLAAELAALRDDFNFDVTLTGFGAEEADEIIKAWMDVADGEMRDLPDKPEFTQMAFILSERQRAIVEAALATAKKKFSPESVESQNSNGNALEFVCQRFIDGAS